MRFFVKDRIYLVSEILDLADRVPGAHVRCDADKGTFERVRPADAYRRTLWRNGGQLAALRAPVNRSQLRGFDFMVLHAIGRNTWNRYMTSPINSDVYATEQAYQAEAWRDAMQQMRSFYAQAVKRKGVNFENV